MGKVEVKQTPRRLNPYGEKLMKIWYDDSMPPKKYIWYKDEEYHFWNGEYWEPFELGDSDEGVNNKDNNNGNRNHGKCDNHCNCSCECCEEIKFEKFKKDVLSAVLRMIKGHEQESPEELEDRIEVLERNVESLMQINHDLFVKNTELESLLEELGYLKEDDIEDLEVLSGLDERLTNIENRVSNNESNIRNFNSRITALENANYITEEDLAEYVNEAISRIHVPTKVSDLENDSGFISEVNVELIDSQEEPIVLANGDVISLVETATYNRDENKIKINRHPYQINIETEDVEPFDPSELEEHINSVENDLSEIKQKVDNNELVIASAFNDLNDRLLNVDGNISEVKEEINQNLSEHEEVAAAAFNDLNDRMLSVENKLTDSAETRIKKEEVIAAAFNDLNDRMISVVERVDKIESDISSGGDDELTPDKLVYHESEGVGYFESVGYNNMKNTLESNTGSYLVVSNGNDWMVFEIQNGDNGVLLNRVEPPSTETLGTIEEEADDKYKLQFYDSLGVSDGTRFNWEISGTY